MEFGRKANPQLTIIARSHSEDETAHLKKHGATEVVMGEHEIAKAMIAGIPPSLDAAVRRTPGEAGRADADELCRRARRPERRQRLARMPRSLRAHIFVAPQPS